MSTEVIQTMRTGVDEHPQEIMNFLTSFFFTSGGVLDKNGNDLKLAAIAGQMKIQVLMGRAIIPDSNGVMAYPFYMHTDDADLAVTSNGSGNARKDTVVAYIDKGASPDTTGTNVAKLLVIAGTPSASPVAPDDTAIQAAIGASNPYLRLGNFTVPTGATEILSANIEDTRVFAEAVLRQPKIQGAYQDWITLTPGANVVIDLSKGNKFKVTINQNTTFSVVNAKPGQSFQVRVTQNGTGGWTTTWFSGIGWAYQNTPVQTPTANRSDKYGFDVISEGVYDGVIMGQDQ